ncbi:MAG: HepT-like ribonuclease domain-containing protein [Candidatus Shapirobacteria bacterium]
MAIDKKLITKKLNQLEEIIIRIENMDFGGESLEKEIDLQDLLTFRLVQGVELAIDTATHLISGLKLDTPETSKSSFNVLAQNKIISQKLANRLSNAVGFRNIAIHRYTSLDFSQLFKDYKEDLKDLKDFAAQVWKFILRAGKPRSLLRG